MQCKCIFWSAKSTTIPNCQKRWFYTLYHTIRNLKRKELCSLENNILIYEPVIKSELQKQSMFSWWRKSLDGICQSLAQKWCSASVASTSVKRVSVTWWIVSSGESPKSCKIPCWGWTEKKDKIVWDIFSCCFSLWGKSVSFLQYQSPHSQ